MIIPTMWKNNPVLFKSPPTSHHMNPPVGNLQSSSVPLRHGHPSVLRSICSADVQALAFLKPFSAARALPVVNSYGGDGSCRVMGLLNGGNGIDDGLMVAEWDLLMCNGGLMVV